MDWFKSSLQIAQKQAQEAAEKARALAQQASQHALVLAEQASEQARVLAEQASEQAKAFAEQASEKAKQASEKAKEFAAAAAEEAQAKLQQLATQGVTNYSEAESSELAKYGVTPGLLETICGMTYSTFSDYPLELLPTTNPMGLSPPIPTPGFRLSPWQERHALLVLSKGDQLQGLRFALCPKIMSEELFWIIYFTLVKTLLPPEAFKPAAEEPAGGTAGTPGGSAAFADVQTAAAPTQTTASSSSAVSPGPASAACSSRRLSTAAATPAGAPQATASAAAGAASPQAAGAASERRASLVGDEAVLVDVASSSNAGDHVDGGDDDDDDEDGEVDGGDADLDALEDDPELAAYLQEALDVAEGGEGEGLSDLGSATDDLDDYINQLDAELGANGDGESPAKSH